MERNRKDLSLPLTSSSEVFSPCFSPSQASPMTALSASMGGLSCLGNTPKRRLSLSSLGETPPARPSFSRQSSRSSGISTGTASPCVSPFMNEQFQLANSHLDTTTESTRHGVQFRRFNSMPLRMQQMDSPSLQVLHRPRLIRQTGVDREGEHPDTPSSPVKQAVQRPRVLDVGGSNEDQPAEQRAEDKKERKEEDEEGEEGLWMKLGGKTKRKDVTETRTDARRTMLLVDLPSPSELEEVTLPSDDAFTFVRPKPFSARTAPSTDQSAASGRPISAPATLLDEAEDDNVPEADEAEDDNVPLRQDRLTSFHDDEDDDADHDDGFSEFFDIDSQEGSLSGCSSGLAGLINAPLINPVLPITSPPRDHQSSHSSSNPLSAVDCNTLNTTPSSLSGAPPCRKGIFKIPSQPALLPRRNSALLKRCERPRDSPSPIRHKRPRSSSIASPQVTERNNKEESPPPTRKGFTRSLSMLSPSDPYFKRIDHSLSVEGSQTNLIGDRTMACCLPTVPGKHKDLKCISPETLCALLRSDFSRDIGECHIIDCRYPYEYRGGHIQGAINIYQENELKRMFLDNPLAPLCNSKRRVFVFHCEFSSHRGPKLLRFLRKEDRSANLENYPALYYPEIYLLNEGYKAFYEHSTEFCEPRTYMPMNHDNHTDDLRFFRSKSKSWTEKSKLKIRSQSLF